MPWKICYFYSRYMSSVSEVVAYLSGVHTSPVLPELIVVENLDHFAKQSPVGVKFRQSIVPILSTFNLGIFRLLGLNAIHWMVQECLDGLSISEVLIPSKKIRTIHVPVHQPFYNPQHYPCWTRTYLYRSQFLRFTGIKIGLTCIVTTDVHEQMCC